MERVLGRAPSSLPAFAVPDKRRRLCIPASRRLLEPAADLHRAVRMLPGERAAFEDALDRLGHVEPTAAHGRVQRHDPVRTQPQHQLGRLMAGEIVPHQQKPQRRQLLRQGKRQRQSRLPHLPGGARSGGILHGSRCRQLRENCAQVLPQPRMQRRIRASLGRLQAHLAGGGMKQGQDLGRAAADILVRLGGRAAARLPRHTRMRHRLEGTRLVLAPDR